MSAVLLKRRIDCSHCPDSSIFVVVKRKKFLKKQKTLLFLNRWFCGQEMWCRSSYSSVQHCLVAGKNIPHSWLFSICVLVKFYTYLYWAEFSCKYMTALMATVLYFLADQDLNYDKNVWMSSLGFTKDVYIFMRVIIDRLLGHKSSAEWPNDSPKKSWARSVVRLNWFWDWFTLNPGTGCDRSVCLGCKSPLL